MASNAACLHKPRVVPAFNCFRVGVVVLIQIFDICVCMVFFFQLIYVSFAFNTCNTSSSSSMFCSFLNNQPTKAA